MIDRNTNPFVLPGMGQGSGETAGNPLLASMEMMRQAWAGLTGPGGLAQALPMTPPMNLQDLERRIAELRTVESWLRMNLSMLSSTIQGLEVQRSTIATLRSFVDSLGAQAQDPAAWAGASPLEIVLGLKPAPGQAAPPRQDGAASPFGAERGAGREDADADAAARHSQASAWGASPFAQEASGPDDASTSPTSSSTPFTPSTPSTPSAQAISQAAQSASEAWWGMLQQQFSQLAAATAATMPGGAAGAKATPETAADTPPGAGPDARRETKAGARKSSAPKVGGSRNGSTSAGSAASKSGVRKSKIQSKSNPS